MHTDTIHPLLILPFAILLGSIALMPLIAHGWWERHYPKVALGLGAITLIWYLFVLRDIHAPLHTAHEYASFITLVGSLFIISGGIVIRVKGESTPWVNTLFLAIGGVLANLIGTTGASMLLIRPFLRMNKYRLTTYHAVFFIFIVSNVGGCLTPIGDPPLYLGYLKGIPFFWTLHRLYPMWLMAMGWLLMVFFILDWRNFQRAPTVIRDKETSSKAWRFEGLHNLLWLGLVLGALFIRNPPFLREGIMILASILSWWSTKKQTHQANDFSWAPMKEVAILFAGIFATMIPALQWLEVHASQLGAHSVSSFYWGSGILSAVLDNAPTYLNFLSASIGLFVNQEIIAGVQEMIRQGGSIVSPSIHGTHSTEIIATFKTLQLYHPEGLRMNAVSSADIQIAYLLGNHPMHIAAISIGAVFFGACTYIGNGPNFMVKSIAESWGAKMPGFFGYILRFTLPFLLPMLVCIGWIFFRIS